MKKFTIIGLLTVFLTLSACSSSTEPDPPVKPVEPRVLTGDSVHVSLGIPADNDATDDYIVIRHQYALSYNQFKGVPNWVSYEMNASWFGEAERYSGNFITDNTLPLEIGRAHV